MIAPEVQQWFDFAEMDLGVARHLYDTYYPQPYEIICYHCQQSSEKAVKCLICAEGSGGGIPRSHDLTFLMNQIKNRFVIPSQLWDYADILSDYGIAARYPNEMLLERNDARKAIAMATEILEWCREQIETVS